MKLIDKLIISAFFLSSPVLGDAKLESIISMQQAQINLLSKQLQELLERPVLTKDSVTTTHIKDAAITTYKLGSAAVTSEKLASYSVDSSKLKNYSINEEKLVSGIVAKRHFQYNSKNLSSSGYFSSDKPERLPLGKHIFCSVTFVKLTQAGSYCNVFPSNSQPEWILEAAYGATCIARCLW